MTEWDILDGSKFGPAQSENKAEYNSVADMLYYLPIYDYYVNDQIKTKTEKYFDIWQRPTI